MNNCSMQHIAFDYDVVKSTVCDSISWGESTLIKSEKFHLPSKKKMYSDKSIEDVLIDVTEVEIECPQKNKNNITQAKRKNTH